MSAQQRLPGFEGPGSRTRPPAEAVRASIGRELRYLLARSSEAGRGFGLTPAGLAHSVGVCLIEDSNMARGKGKAGQGSASAAMPRFVDVRLTAEQRSAFLDTTYTDAELVSSLQTLADEGYRVGVTWAGEQQAYTVSLTCREPDDPNNGLCMTSFARELRVALGLMVFKHYEVAERLWLKASESDVGEFG